MGQVEFLAKQLASYPADVGRDFAAVVRVALRECPRRWTRTGGVQHLWVALGDSPDGVLVSVRRPARKSLAGYLYADDIHTAHAFRQDVDRELGDHRCLALLVGNGWRSVRLPFASSVDSAVFVVAKHRSGVWLDAGLKFTRRRFRRIQFDPRLHQLVAGVLAEARGTEGN
jgi:hypothetical protein